MMIYAMTILENPGEELSSLFFDIVIGSRDGLEQLKIITVVSLRSGGILQVASCFSWKLYEFIFYRARL